MKKFKTYQDYLDYTDDGIRYGNYVELLSYGLLIPEVVYFPESGEEESGERYLTEEEFNKKFKK